MPDLRTLSLFLYSSLDGDSDEKAYQGRIRSLRNLEYENNGIALSTHDPEKPVTKDENHLSNYRILSGHFPIEVLRLTPSNYPLLFGRQMGGKEPVFLSKGSLSRYFLEKLSELNPDIEIAEKISSEREGPRISLQDFIEYPERYPWSEEFWEENREIFVPKSSVVA